MPDVSSYVCWPQLFHATETSFRLGQSPGEGVGGGGVLKEILYGEALPRCLTPYPVINLFWQEWYPFGIPFIDK